MAILIRIHDLGLAIPHLMGWMFTCGIVLHYAHTLPHTAITAGQWIVGIGNPLVASVIAIIGGVICYVLYRPIDDRIRRGLTALLG